MNILGISAFYHDSAACIIQEGRIKAAAQEERFSRIKHDASFPRRSIEFCLDYCRLSLADIDAVVFYEKPLLKFERLLETYYAYAPKGLTSFLVSMPIWLKEKLFQKSIIRKELQKLGKFSPSTTRILFSEHHLSHAASAFYPSGFEEAAILTIDGVGEWATASIGHGHKNNIKVLKELRFPNSVGLLYSSFTYFLGFEVNSGEYKMMGLAPYANPEADETRKFIDIIRSRLVDIMDDGSIRLNDKYFRFATGLRMINEIRWSRIFGFAKRSPDEPVEQHHCNLAYAIQCVTEEIILKMAREARRITNSERLCLAGGVALNCVANSVIRQKGGFRDVYFQAAASDAGGAVGAALAAYYIYFKNKRIHIGSSDPMNGAYLGPEYSGEEIKAFLEGKNLQADYFEDQKELADTVAHLLEDGKIIGWFQGRMEFGPRALGNRSILANAAIPEMQDIINKKVKRREPFRPFAPAVLLEDAKRYFDIDVDSPYMLLTFKLKGKYAFMPGSGFTDLKPLEKLEKKKAYFSSITHVDNSARVQTVDGVHNPKFSLLLEKYKMITGHGLLLNTSFNINGEPIVCSPEDALKCFYNCDMDYIVLDGFLIPGKQAKNRIKSNKELETIIK